MGRRAVVSALRGRVREVRAAQGLSQAELAGRTRLTRQAISAIEAGQYVPNTVVALRLARALHCSVESLFAIPPDDGRELRIVPHAAERSRRLAVASVGGQWIGHALADAREIQQGFVSADAVLSENRADSQATFVTSSELIERTALLLGCDPSLGIVSAHMARRSPDTRLLWLSAASQSALDSVAKNEAHLAGTHLHGEGEDNLGQARLALKATGGLVMEFARWEQGFATAAGNPKSIRGIEDLARPDVRIVNREPGSGSRALLDSLLQRQRIASEVVRGYERIASSHLSAAAIVANGAADVAITLRASAQAYGLDFIPLDQVRFDFVIPRPYVDHPAVAPMLDVLQSERLRAEIGALPGYEVTTMGTLRAEIPPN